MPAFFRTNPLSFASMTTVLVVILPTAVALVIAHWLSMQHIQESATRMAHQLLARADVINIEMDRAARMLAPLDRQDPCGEAGMQLMRKALLHNETLIDVGYVRDDHLLCSALGRQGLPLGKPAYTSSEGFAIRNDVRLRDAPGISLLAATSQKSGTSLFVRPAQVMDDVPANEPWDMAIVEIGPKGVVLAQRGQYDTEWRQRMLGRRSHLFIHGQHLVAWERSKVGTYMAFAAMPDSMWLPAQRSSMLLGLLLGLPASLLLLLVLRRMSLRSTTIRYMLRQALKRDELSLAYQPIVELATGRWIGAEALMRWNRPRGETISPDVFIPIAETSGLMPVLREHLIRTIERETPALFSHHPDFHIALNFCAEDLCAADLPARLQAAIERIKGKPGNLQVEVTERAFLHLEQARPSIDELQKRGIAVAIDDFGTGFSSLSYLTALKFDCLKIDRTFIDTINTGAVTSSIVDHIIAMSKSLGITTIAEGVETQAQADYLREQGVHYAQGWLYAKALPIRDLLDRLASSQQNRIHTQPLNERR